jgi:peptidyl-prolyl cis-trans isomerase D
MMDGIRKAGQSLIGRIIITVLFGFLVFSFALWGIGDIFRGYGLRNVASVGSSEIDTQTYRAAFQTELQALSRRYGRNITTEQALSVGIDRQVLGRLISEAALDDTARAMKLGISDDTIVKKLLTDRNFTGPNGQFDKARFNEALRAAGYTEAGFIAEQRKLDIRQQVIQSLSGSPSVPTLISNALNVFTNEERSAEMITIGKEHIGASAPPDDATLAKFFEENKQSFRAPEYRKIAYIALSPTDLVAPDTISEAEAKAKYEAELATRYTFPEKRAVQQLVLTSETDAKAVSERIKAGANFDDIVAEKKLQKADTDLGVVEKKRILDPAVADAAFSLAKGAVSDVIVGKFGFILVSVTDIIPAETRSFESALPEIRAALAISKGKELIRDLHDKIEDQRASAKALTEIAKDQSLKLSVLEMTDRAGRLPDGTSIESIPERDTLLNAAFSSDIGVDNEPLPTRTGGYIWFDVQTITPARDRPLEEVKDKVIASWADDDLNGRLAAKTAELVAMLNTGKSMQEVAASLNVEIKTVEGLKRNGQSPDLAQAAVAQVFAVLEGAAGSAIGHQPLERVIFRVTKAGLQSSVTALADQGKIMNEIKLSLSDDYANAYVGEVQKELGVTVNNAVLGMALGVN